MVILDSLGIPEAPAESLPKRFQRWIAQLQEPPQNKIYSSFGELAKRVQKRHPKLSEERADFVARCWAQETAPGRIELLGDPRHRLRMPNLYRANESMVMWQQVTAEVFCVDGGDSAFNTMLSPEEKTRRRAAFRNCRTEIIPGASHMLHHDHPAETAALIESFLPD
jgi:pimeloyl-ACP methyl ester carboxylesterase